MEEETKGENMVHNAAREAVRSLLISDASKGLAAIVYNERHDAYTVGDLNETLLAGGDSFFGEKDDDNFIVVGVYADKIEAFWSLASIESVVYAAERG